MGSWFQVSQIKLADWYELSETVGISSFDNNGFGRDMKYAYRAF
jgi:hypothetical protein